MRDLYGRLTAYLSARLAAGTAALASLLVRPDDDPERGDVPGWVLVTVMTAGLVTVLWAIAGDRLSQMFESALDAVQPGR